jgi:hypothetical protein
MGKGDFAHGPDGLKSERRVGTPTGLRDRGRMAVAGDVAS